jgi:hypothetical protein
MIVLLLVVALQAYAASGFRIVSTCDESAEVRANIQKDAQLKIHSSVGGGSPCYSVTATVEGKQVQGYVIDRSLDAVVAFEKANAEFSRKALIAIQAPPSPPAEAPATQSAPSASTAADTAKPVKEVPKPHKQPIIAD